MSVPDLSGVTVVANGSFNPVAFHPRWLSDKGILKESLASHAVEVNKSSFVVSEQLTAFVADWLTVQVTQKQAVFATVDRVREPDLRDFAIGFLELVAELPVDALGINADAHVRAANEAKWHSFGDAVLPKDFWESKFSQGDWMAREGGERVGLRSVSVEVHRNDKQLPGYLRVEVAPSLRIMPNGVYVGANAHFQLTSNTDRRASGKFAARVLREHWEATRKSENNAIDALLESL